jgi:histidinol-phosphate aminotransferase
MAALPGIQVFPSAANFLLIRIAGAVGSADTVFANLLARQVLIKNVGKMHPLLQNCLRITVSTPEENAALLSALTASLPS